MLVGLRITPDSIRGYTISSKLGASKAGIQSGGDPDTGEEKLSAKTTDNSALSSMCQVPKAVLRTARLPAAARKSLARTIDNSGQVRRIDFLGS
jgi:hypothetical protein